MQSTTSTYRYESSVQAAGNCKKVRQFANWGMLLCAIGQMLIEESGSNLISVLIAAAMSAFTFHFMVRGSVIRALPIPALIVLGFNVSTMSGALITQTLNLRALAYNLQVPQTTFALCALFQISLLVAFFIFHSSSSLCGSIRTLNRRVFSRMGIMQAPAPLQLWLMGLVGSAAMLWSAADKYVETTQYGDVGAKFIAAMGYLAFAPFIVPILDKVFPFTRVASVKKSTKWLLLCYLVLLVLIAMIRNSRGTFMLGIANLGLAALLLLLLGQLDLNKRLRRGLLFGAVVVLMVAPIFADLAIAMVVVRGERSEVFGTKLVTLTLEAFNDKPTLERYRKAVATVTGSRDYEEDYIANPFMARFVNTKFFDNTLSYESVRAGNHADALWAVTLDKIGAILPTPVLSSLGIGINKEKLQFSMGDALYNAQTGAGLGGYKTGSPIGHGMALMGPFVFIATIPLFLLTFMAVQSLTLVIGSYVVISPVILLQLMPIFGLAAGDSLLEPIGLILRTLPQSILIYWLVFQGSHWVSEFRQRRSRYAMARRPIVAKRWISDSSTATPRYKP